MNKIEPLSRIERLIRENQEIKDELSELRRSLNSANAIYQPRPLMEYEKKKILNSFSDDDDSGGDSE